MNAHGSGGIFDEIAQRAQDVGGHRQQIPHRTNELQKGQLARFVCFSHHSQREGVSQSTAFTAYRHMHSQRLTFIEDRKHCFFKGTHFDVKVGKQFNRSYRACRIMEWERAQRGSSKTVYGRYGKHTTMMNVDVVESAIQRVDVVLR